MAATMDPDSLDALAKMDREITWRRDAWRYTACMITAPLTSLVAGTLLREAVPSRPFVLHLLVSVIAGVFGGLFIYTMSTLFRRPFHDGFRIGAAKKALLHQRAWLAQRKFYETLDRK